MVLSSELAASSVSRSARAMIATRAPSAHVRRPRNSWRLPGSPPALTRRIEILSSGESSSQRSGWAAGSPGQEPRGSSSAARLSIRVVLPTWSGPVTRRACPSCPESRAWRSPATAPGLPRRSPSATRSACHNGAMRQGSMRQLDATPVGRTGGATPRVPWDWTDVVIFFGAYLLGVSVLSEVFVDPGVERFARGLTHGLGPQVQTALANFAEQTAVYAFAMAVVAVLVLGRRHASLRDLGWRVARVPRVPIAGVSRLAAPVGLTWP